MTHAWTIAAATLLVSACAIPPENAHQPFDRGTYALIVRGDTTVLDEFTRTPGLLQGLVTPQRDGAKFGWARYSVEIDATGEISRAELRMGPRGAPSDGPGTAVYTVTLSAGVLLEEGSDGTVSERQVPRGTIPVFAPSIAMHDEIVRLALARAGRGPAQIPVWSFPAVARLDTAGITWRGDTASVTLSSAPPARFLLVSGRPVSLGTADGEFRVTRLP